MNNLERYVQDVLLSGERGGFAAALGEAWCVADSNNRAKLCGAFPAIFTPPADFNQPTVGQLQRLREFAAEHGRDWKVILNGMWLSGRDANQRDGHLLRQVRNQLGPVWLNDFKLEI